MKNLNIITCIIPVFITFNCFAQKAGRISLSSASPKQGEKVSLTYQTPLNNTDELKGYMLYLTPDANYYTLDVPLKKVDEGYQSEVTFPDSAAVAGFVFKNKDEQDANDGKGYIFILKNKENKDVAGAYRGLSLLHEGLGNYLIGMKTDRSFALDDLEMELKTHPELKEKVLPSYYALLVANNKADAAAKAKQELLKMFSAADEDNQYKIYYAIARTDKSAGDSLKLIAINKYPNGVLAGNDALANFSKIQDLSKMEAEYDKLMAGKDSKVNRDMLTYYLARAYSNHKDYDKVLTTLDKMKVKGNAPSILNSAAWPMAEAGEQLAVAEKLSKRSLDYIDELKQNEKYLANYSSSQREDILNANYASYADTYALISFKEGKLKEALKYQEKAVNLNHFSSAEMNERYTQFLIANGDDAKATDQLKMLISDGDATAKMKDQLKAIYTRNHSENEYNVLLASLEKSAKEKARRELVSKMINIKSPDFSLKNLKGEVVSLASLKGKVVVVDFWATWCGPCKASFPGMQKAVNKYKDNDDVAFVFIDTWENVHDGKRTDLVSKFIEDNKYTFNVLMDTEEPGDKSKYAIVSAFGVEGIPTKFILDKKGNIRFKAVGFSGGDDALADEIATMVTLAADPPTTASIK